LRPADYHRLFKQDVFAGVHRLDGHTEMSKRWRGDNYGIDAVVLEYIPVVGAAVGDIVFFHFLTEDFSIDVGQPQDVCPACFHNAVKVEAGDHTSAYYAYVWFVFHGAVPKTTQQ
jgi:hypothetical protein